MQKDTKSLISSTFVELLSSKPFDRITIKDIVDACGINRNTFYYLHFYYRTALKEESMAVVDEILQSASWMR